MSWIRLAPVTAESLILCVAMFWSCAYQASTNHESYEDVQRSWGAIQVLDHVDILDGIRRERESTLSGPLDVWGGEWWRIPVTVFHHADLLHLVLNLGAAWYLGSRLENRWGSFSLAMFLIPAVCIPVMAELCLGHAYQGFAGANCAMLGALFVIRQFDSRVASQFPVEITEIGMVAIVACWFSTLVDFMSFANSAHFSGCLYGAAVAGMTSGHFRRVMLVRLSTILIHFWLIPALFLVTHPIWIARYHWYSALSNRNLPRAEKSLERASKLQPHLTGVWLRWSRLAEEKRDLDEAWRRVMTGLAANRSSLSLIDGSRRLWRRLDNLQRQNAEQTLTQLFGQEDKLWLNQIRTGAIAPAPNSNEELIDDDQFEDSEEYPLNQKVELPLLVLPKDPLNRHAPMGPLDANDAVEGETF